MVPCFITGISLRYGDLIVRLHTEIPVVQLKIVLKEAGGEIRLLPSRQWRSRQHLFVSFTLSRLPLHQGDWVLLAASLPEGEFTILPLSATLRRRLLFRGASVVMNQSRLLAFPMAGDQDRLMIRVRPRTIYDTSRIWLMERIAWAVGLVGRQLGVGRDILVIFEKFCAQAQDNGFAYFEWCMQQLPEKKRRQVYFILDRRHPDWPVLKKTYGVRLVAFMSFKHMCLMMLSGLYIASESRYHGYLWQTRPNPLFRDIRNSRHRILFLQHGVTALKRVEKVFGRQGYNPMTWFAVTSPGEQEIAIRFLGYTARQAPILGFTRWDRLKDCQDPLHPRVLLMPTWRSWLEKADEESFAESEYYQVYEKLLTSPRFTGFLKEMGISVSFYIHPKLAGLLGAFHQAGGEGIRLISYGSERLDQLIMESSALITDYSSICWDFCYLSKPVIFYQFDAARYLETTGSYLNFETDLPGERVFDEAELIRAVRRLADGGWKPSEEAKSRASVMLPRRDGQNCARTDAFVNKVCRIER